MRKEYGKEQKVANRRLLFCLYLKWLGEKNKALFLEDSLVFAMILQCNLEKTVLEEFTCRRVNMCSSSVLPSHVHLFYVKRYQKSLYLPIKQINITYG